LRLGDGWRDALTAALCSVIAWQIVGTIAGDAEASTIRPGIWRGVMPLLIAVLAGYGGALLARRGSTPRDRGDAGPALLIAVLLPLTLHIAAAGMTAADFAAKGQDVLILPALRQLLLVLVLPTAVAVVVPERPLAWPPAMLAAAAGLAVTAAVGVALAAPLLRSQIWGPMLTATALGADAALIQLAWQLRASRFAAPIDLITGRSALTSVTAVGVWIVVSGLL